MQVVPKPWRLSRGRWTIASLGFPTVQDVLKQLYVLVLGRASKRIPALIYLMQAARKRRLNVVVGLISRILESRGVFIAEDAQIGEKLVLPHPTSIVIGNGVRVGKGVTIYQGVTLGGRIVGDAKSGNYPTVCDDTVLFAGAVVIGRVTIGSACVIGANSVVNSSLPDRVTAVGAPARIVRSNLGQMVEELNND
jgi:serine O-acetyltransferase